ncbi:ribosome biogenesis protein SLX9 homolog isoform X1 [Anolis carolinensis]|uniref:ribosome biogenesis protein SLX9 homolog isoform X1 n=1 Tax=Anolis carolinensis TaxID=28377 RepID=UPI0004626900|nr:PREDICTED: protein FAM207A [Anolis carolinensis]|eukprot:XP_008107414.1 PREDICTED: protein FAM207A [Anolis carolinensis]
MVGKVRRRPRLHPAAPKPAPQPQGGEGLAVNAFPFAAPQSKPVKAARDPVLLTSDIFAGVKIDPKSLVKKLDTHSRSTVSTIKDGDEKTLLSKKEKMKLRKDRWLQKIEGIKVAKQQQKAEAKRKATPVIGDLHPLMDALPELSDLMTLRKFPKHHKIQVKKRVPTNFNQMNSAQKSKALVEEIAQFHKTISDPLFKANPLAVISEHLSKRLMQEREGEPL